MVADALRQDMVSPQLSGGLAAAIVAQHRLPVLGGVLSVAQEGRPLQYPHNKEQTPAV